MFKTLLAGGFWVGVRQFGARGMGLLVFYLISAFVGPEELGLLSMAWVFVAVADGLFGFGMFEACLREKNLRTVHLNTLFWSLLLQGLMWYAVAYLTAPAIGRFFGNEELVEIVRVLGLMLPLRAFGGVPLLQLTRDMAFRKVALLELSIVFLSGVLGVYLATQGMGVWSLVWRHIAATLLRTVFSLFMTDWWPAFAFSLSKARAFLQLGLPISLSFSLAWLVELQFQQSLIGTALGAAALGIFNFGKKPFDMLSQLSSAMCSSVFVPMLVKRSDLVGNRTFVKRTLLYSALGLAVSVTVCIVGFFALRSVDTQAFGEWDLAYRLMPLFGIAFSAKLFADICQSYLLVVGESKALVVGAIAEGALGVALVWLAIAHGLYYVAMGSVVASFAAAGVLLYYVLRSSRKQESALSV